MRERYDRLSPEEKQEIREKLRDMKQGGNFEERKALREQLREKRQQQNDKD
jgi:hypothetical protein